MTDAATVLERCARLGEISEEPGLLVRPFGSPSMRAANELVADWMRDAGLDVREDAVGNLIGRREGGGRTLVFGSHLDTVRDAGRYDGPLGVLAGIAVAERVGPLPFALEVVGFADEEGLRYGTAFLGSAAMAGRFDPSWLELRDERGVPLRDLLRGDPAGAARSDELLGYCELHIEQGPVLEARGEPIAVVDAIAGQSHLEATFTGEAGHAGTVPMASRGDALAAAAELVLAVEAAAAGGLVATVGRLTVEPGARNVIPGRVALTVEVRDADDDVRRAAVERLRALAREIAERRGVDLEWRETAEIAAVAMDATLTGRLTAAAGPVPRLTSGAGHDAAMMASIAPAAMLFVRCARGISHHPDESVEAADVAVALDVLERFVRAL